MALSSSCRRVSRCIRPSSGSAHRVHRESAKAMVSVAAMGTSRCSAGRTSGPWSSGSSIRRIVGPWDVTPAIRPRPRTPAPVAAARSPSRE